MLPRSKVFHTNVSICAFLLIYKVLFVSRWIERKMSFCRYQHFPVWKLGICDSFLNLFFFFSFTPFSEKSFHHPMRFIEYEDFGISNARLKDKGGWTKHVTPHFFGLNKMHKRKKMPFWTRVYIFLCVDEQRKYARICSFTT